MFFPLRLVPERSRHPSPARTLQTLLENTCRQDWISKLRVGNECRRCLPCKNGSVYSVITGISGRWSSEIRVAATKLRALELTTRVTGLFWKRQVCSELPNDVVLIAQLLVGKQTHRPFGSYTVRTHPRPHQLHSSRFPNLQFPIFSNAARAASRPASSSCRKRKFSNHSNTNRNPVRSRSVSPRNCARSFLQHHRACFMASAVVIVAT